VSFLFKVYAKKNVIIIMINLKDKMYVININSRAAYSHKLDRSKCAVAELKETMVGNFVSLLDIVTVETGYHVNTLMQ